MSSYVKSRDAECASSGSYFSPQQAEKELTYRIPMCVTTVRLFQSGTAYAVCPRCRISLEREYVAFCDVCGQKLNWQQFGSAKVVCVTERAYPSD